MTVYGPYLMSIVDPTFTYHSIFENYRTTDPVEQAMAALVQLVTMSLHAYGALMTKRLHKINSIQINFVLGVLIAISASLLIPLTSYGGSNSGHERPMDFMVYIKSFLFAGVPMCYGQLAYIGALILTKNMGVVTTLSFASIIFGYFVSVIRYD